MRIALFNLHFETLGGGERRTAALAEHLSQSHEVILYVLQPANREVIHSIFVYSPCESMGPCRQRENRVAARSATLKPLSVPESPETRSINGTIATNGAFCRRIHAL